MPRPKGSKNKKYKNKILGIPTQRSVYSKTDFNEMLKMLISQGYIMTKEDFIPWIRNIIIETMDPILINLTQNIIEQVFPVGITLIFYQMPSQYTFWYNNKPYMKWLNMDWEFLMITDPTSNITPIPIGPMYSVINTGDSWIPRFEVGRIVNQTHKHTISGTTEDTVLDVRQIPSHKHTVDWDGIHLADSGPFFWYLARVNGGNPTFETSSTGGNVGHHHSIMPTNTTISEIRNAPEFSMYLYFINRGHLQ